MIRTKIVSSLEKCFLDESIDKFEELKSISVLKNERLFVQLLYRLDSAFFPVAVDGVGSNQTSACHQRNGQDHSRSTLPETALLEIELSEKQV